MNFLRLNDYLLSILFEDEDILAIDKPYGFNAHTNDSKIEHSEFIQDGLIEIYEKQIGKKLHIIHRLDQTTTGVMIFGKSVESAKKYAEFFFERKVKKTYWFITKNKSSDSKFLIDQKIIHKGRELEAKTQLSFLKKSAGFELWKANPFTGRNHQIRIHAQTANISILGDEKYDGHSFLFLCLHNQQIEFPNGIIITSKPPVYFENLELLEDPILTRALFQADRRLRFFSSADSDQCFRIAHTINNSKEAAFTIDQFGKVIVLNWFKEKWNAEEVQKFSFFSGLLKKSLILRRPSDKKSETTDKNNGPSEPQENNWICKEGQTQYEMQADSVQPGLFLNQRLQRNWVLKNSKNKSVLNLFSYTGGYSLVAALGEAEQVTSVDLSKNNLNWCKKNFELNGLVPDKFNFLFRDSLDFLEQCLRKNAKYDLIICDTPSFIRREKTVFKIESGLENLLLNCLQCLTDKGELLFSTNFDGFFINDIRESIIKVQKKIGLLHLEINCILPALDFELPNEKANLKSFLIRIG